MRRAAFAIATLFVAMIALVGHRAGAEGTTCSVRNARTDSSYPSLQEAADAAQTGDTLKVRGVCVGTTSIVGTGLRLLGVATFDQPLPTLDGGGVGPVLGLTDAEVTLRDLRVTNGRTGRRGGGIREIRGSLMLRGTTTITGNVAGGGGGIFSWKGRLAITGSSTVQGNTATDGIGGGVYAAAGWRWWQSDPSSCVLSLRDTATVAANAALTDDPTFPSTGGGISSWRCPIHMTDSSSVVGNSAGYGGGIDAAWHVTIDDSATIASNTATHHGGGVSFANGHMTVTGRASVRENTAGKSGGGIYNAGHLVLEADASVAGNVAGDNGGGIVSFDKTVFLEGTSSVSGNEAGGRGGGVFLNGRYGSDPSIWLRDRAKVVRNVAGVERGGIGALGGTIRLCSDLVAISPNDPDDPPETLPCGATT